MNNDQYRDGDFLGTEDSARYVGITVSMLSAASALGLLDDEISNTKPSIKELGLPPKANPDNKTTYGVNTLNCNSHDLI